MPKGLIPGDPNSARYARYSRWYRKAATVRISIELNEVKDCTIPVYFLNQFKRMRAGRQNFYHTLHGESVVQDKDLKHYIVNRGDMWDTEEEAIKAFIHKL